MGTTQICVVPMSITLLQYVTEQVVVSHFPYVYHTVIINANRTTSTYKEIMFVITIYALS